MPVDSASAHACDAYDVYDIYARGARAKDATIRGAMLRARRRARSAKIGRAVRR